MTVIPEGEERIEPEGSTRVFANTLQVSGRLQASGRVVVGPTGPNLFGKSRADGTKDLIARSEGEKNLIVRAEGEID